ncbi:hypothetical protein [Flavobacterium phragmitis]|uniref:Uncharacterized protein n=1 Tax=Flavobacterium phragmitis TaxID=739143 RepID=A0A1I1VPV1_9FLAO|nr:hypothetical protein [Flavobacterium phragmitis]SFD85122.1 hypothetical protein SAMN05216297_11351 [Flavobacterium phragmitis]
MNSTASTQEKTTFREVYIFDMEVLQRIFSKNKCGKTEDKMLFGIPFLLSKKGNRINAFASLILDQNNEIQFKIYDDENLTDKEEATFNAYIVNFLKKKRSANFNNAVQLKKSTEHFVHYLSF